MRSAASTFVLVLAFLIASCGGTDRSVDNAANQTQSSSAEYNDARVALADGTKLLDSGETDQAIEVLNRAVQLDPNLAEAYFQLGVAYALTEARDAGNVTAADESNIDGQTPKPKKANSVIAFEKAVETYKKLIAVSKDDHSAHFNLGRSYNKLNEDEDAEKAFENAVELNPEDTEYQTELGSIRIKLAKFREAIPPLKKALELDPENVEAQELLEDAEAGRRRVDYKSTPKKEEKLSNSNSSNANVPATAASNSSKPPEPPKPQSTKPPVNRP